MNRGGFTLIELLVGVAVIAILAALIAPVLSEAKRGAKAAACTSNLRQLGQSVFLYATDYDDKLPFAPGPAAQKLARQGVLFEGNPFNDLMVSLEAADVLLDPYGAEKALWHCPEDAVSSPHAAGRKPTWWAETGSSYQYDEFDALSSQSLAGVDAPAERTLFYDVEPFHRSRSLIAFFDGHVKSVSSAQKSVYQMVHGYWY